MVSHTRQRKKNAKRRLIAMKSSVQRMDIWQVAPGRVLDTGFLTKHLENQIQQKQKG